MSHLFHQTMSTLERSLTCELIASEVDPIEGIKSVQDSDAALVQWAIAYQYSRIPLQQEGATRRSTITHVALVDLQHGQVLERRAITVDDLISGETPLAKAASLLKERKFCFVLVQDCIRRILTRSDLNKLPMRVYLTTLLAHLEGLLADAIHTTFQDNWLVSLNPTRQQTILNLFEEKRRHDFDTRLIDCTTLSDKSTVIAKSRDLRDKFIELTDACSSLSRNKFEDRFRLISRLRNRLDHGLPPLTEEDDIWRNHVYHNQQLTKETDVAWLADVVERIQAWIHCLAEVE